MKDSFFETEIFETEETEKVVLEVENIDTEDEIEDEQIGENQSREGQPSDDYLEIGIVFIGIFDETRALICSLVSGEDKSKYLFYKKDGKVSKDNEMVIAAARVAQKYNLTFGVEFLLIAGLIASSVYMMKIANDDRKAKKADKAKNKVEKPI